MYQNSFKWVNCVVWKLCVNKTVFKKEKEPAILPFLSFQSQGSPVDLALTSQDNTRECRSTDRRQLGPLRTL